MYRSKFENSQKRKGLDSARNVLLLERENAYGTFREFLVNNVVQKGKSFFYSFLKDVYLQCLEEEGDKCCKDIPNAFSVEKLKDKILADKQLKDHVKFIHRGQNLVLLPKSANLENFNFDELVRQDVIARAAFLIRREILDMEKKELPDPLTADALIEGECSLPDNLSNFYKYLLSGGNSRRKKSDSFKRKTESLAQDVIDDVTNGGVKPSKHITLGMAVKSLTSSKIVVDILNSLGHCCSYTTLLGFETEITYTCVQSNRICPNDISTVPNLNTGLAYNNFDKFVETIEGRDTLHDTVGIIFQDIDILTNPEGLLPSQEIPTPMWVGYNSKLIQDTCKQQRMSYLTPLNASPTDDSVVLETLKQAQQVAEGCQEKYAQVTYDLAVAILVDSGILANGSLSSFLSGKHFHRGERLYPLIALALEIIHFQHFVECNEDVSNILTSNEEDIVSYLETFQNARSENPKVENDIIIGVLEKYDKFRQDTLEGLHGKTGQFRLIYCTLVSHYLEFDTAIRTGNHDLFLYEIPKICNLFFSFNHQNYSRWLVQYNENLLSVDETHPGLKDSFLAGSFGMKRTEKPFSKIPVDLTLEQTINADAARSLTGISPFTNSLTARQRWSISHGMRTAILSHIYDVTGVKRKQDVSKDLMPSRLKKDNVHLIKLVDAITDRLNPFSPRLKVDELYQLSTGQPAPAEIADLLLGVLEKGDELRKNFISECIDDEKNERFDRAIKRVAVSNFAILKTKKKLKVGKQVEEVTIQRDLFGRLLAISLNNKIDLEIVMKYPITPVPNVFCHMNGQIHKTDKSPTFGLLALQILNNLCSLKSRKIDIIFDTYPKPSIKATEHKLRGNLDVYAGVIQANLSLPKGTFTANLKDASQIIGDKVIKVNYRKCYEYRSSAGQVIRSECHELSSDKYEEADTKMIYHACKSQKRIVIKCSDTDVLIVLLSNIGQNGEICEIGVSTKRQFINVSKLHEKLGNTLAQALPAFHSFTGCDQNPTFHQKGKKRPFNLLKKSDEFQKACKMMSSLDIIRSQQEYRNTFQSIQKFVCLMYGLKKETEVNRARLAVFSATYTPKKNSEKLLKTLFKYDPSRLPPCEAELVQHFRRTVFISQLWSGLRKPLQLRIEELSENLENDGDCTESPESSDTESEDEGDYDGTDTDDTDEDAE
ncbi:unnamed protein product [Phaedon cochleariae]|uniref:Uncharacterized protein n=1 Tax=Phaedon cochleariae TaxID=80249 RepID=A0A9N9X1R3_PHACE|nr:unnamed protein product [Phaedon cochleariae]